MPDQKRDYPEFARRIENAAGTSMELNVFGHVDGHPIQFLRSRTTGNSSEKVLITAGLQGDEPAGPNAVASLLENGRLERWDGLDFCIVPCLNPYGYAFDQRENAGGQDINRLFDKEGSEAVQLVKEVFQENRYGFYIDLYEDWEAKGYYITRRPAGEPSRSAAGLSSVLRRSDRSIRKHRKAMFRSPMESSQSIRPGEPRA